MRIVWAGVAISVALAFGGGCRVKSVDGEGEPTEDGGTTSSSSSGGTAADAGRDRNAVLAEAPLLPAVSGTTALLNGVWLSADLAFAVAVGDGGAIVTSEDAGKTWEASTDGSVQTTLNAVWGSSADDVWIVGDGATVLHSTNRGGDWQTVSFGSGATPNLTTIWGSGKDQLFVGSAAGDIFRSRDEGATFPIVSNTLGTALGGISGTSATDIWAARGYRILHSTNGGDTWQEIKAQNIYTQHGLWAGGPEDVYTINANAVVRRYDSTAGPEGVLHLTKLDSALCFGCLELRGIAGIAPSDVWVVGDKGFAAHSTARGEWREASAGSNDLRAVASAGGVVIAVGASGAIVRR
jgi:photosystem II stability/assembly factor-like uncharacterized protein